VDDLTTVLGGGEIEVTSFAVRARQEHVPLALRMFLGSFSQKRQHDDMVAAAF
jgi:hypothetical protein